MSTTVQHLLVAVNSNIQPEDDRLAGWERSSGLLFAALLVPAVLIAVPAALLIALRDRLAPKPAADRRLAGRPLS